MEEQLTFNDYVRLSIEANVSPIELRFLPIVECESALPIAYRAEVKINSVIRGDMPQASYTYVSDVKEVGVELFRRALIHAINCHKAFSKCKRNVRFISLRCPADFVEKISLYEIVSSVLNDNPDFDAQKLCIEFPRELLEKDLQAVRTAITDLKILKVLTAVEGCGDSDFPLTKLNEVAPDIAFVSQNATNYVGDRNKPQLFGSLISYIRSMGIEAVAEGNELQRKAMRGSECLGFINVDSELISLVDAIRQKEEEE